MKIHNLSSREIYFGETNFFLDTYKSSFIWEEEFNLLWDRSKKFRDMIESHAIAFSGVYSSTIRAYIQRLGGLGNWGEEKSIWAGLRQS